VRAFLSPFKRGKLSRDGAAQKNDVQALTLPDAKNFILNQHKMCGISAATRNGYTKGIAP